jgi:uncharacterized protein YlxW (UPF0749 family)
MLEQQIRSLQEERDKLAGEVWDQQNTINNLRLALTKANSLQQQVSLNFFLCASIISRQTKQRNIAF